MPFTAAAVQFAPRMGDVVENVRRMGEIIRQCAEEGAELVVFPECAVSGYAIEAGVNEVALEPGELLARLSTAVGTLSRPVDVVVGFYEKNYGQPFNSAGYFELGDSPRVTHVYRKFFLPTYGVFDEERYAQTGQDLGVFNTRFGRLGILICEDVWHSVMSPLVAVSGAEMVIVPIASPARGFSEEKPGNVLRYERMLKALADEHGMFALASCLAGFEGGKGLAGTSSIWSPLGENLGQSPALGEAIVVAEIDFDLCRIARSKSPLLNDLQSRWARVQDLVRETEVDG